METEVTIGDAKLLQGDCVELMAELEPCSVDAVITDPPYMIGAISTGDARAKAGGWADMENSSWWYAEWLKLARRALKQDGFACVFGNWRSLPTLLYAFSKIKWQPVGWAEARSPTTPGTGSLECWASCVSPTYALRRNHPGRMWWEFSTEATMRK